MASGTAGEPKALIEAECDLFDLEGVFIQSFKVEFPESDVGVIELEPFISPLKLVLGFPQGHLVVKSRSDTRHLVRQAIGQSAEVVTPPRVISGREMAFVPLVLGPRRNHIVVIVNTLSEAAQVNIRLMYGERSPEWSVDIPASGCRAIPLELELLSGFDDTSWQRGVVQGYLRLSPRGNSAVSCQVVEQLPGEDGSQELIRTLVS